jgi:hypothetical protein
MAVGRGGPNNHRRPATTTCSPAQERVILVADGLNVVDVQQRWPLRFNHAVEN